MGKLSDYRLHCNLNGSAPAIPNKSFSPPEQSSVVAMAM
jgi:hypothetical protein